MRLARVDAQEPGDGGLDTCPDVLVRGVEELRGGRAVETEQLDAEHVQHRVDVVVGQPVANDLVHDVQERHLEEQRQAA